MTKRNPNFEKLQSSYLFLEIQERVKKYRAENPEAHLINLGIGDTTQPIPKSITKAIAEAAKRLSTKEGYKGYCPEPGIKELREAISGKLYHSKISYDEIFISDGAKCDIGRLQILFGKNAKIAVQNPTYPVYVDGSVIAGVDNIQFLACNKENHFFPCLETLEKTELIYFCSPNNPTGCVASKNQLEQLVQYAKKHKAILIFDAAYASFIQDESLPRSIYEIEGSKEVAIEINSFSKIAGFTGVRLGWTVVPNELKYEDGSFVKPDWNRVVTTLFNGASILSQYGALAVLEEGYEEVLALSSYYLKNAALLKACFQDLGYEVFGGEHAPYLWVYVDGRSSWNSFQKLLEEYHLITTPGSGFGSFGEGYIRISSFNSLENILIGITRLKTKTLLNR